MQLNALKTEFFYLAFLVSFLHFFYRILTFTLHKFNPHVFCIVLIQNK